MSIWHCVCILCVFFICREYFSQGNGSVRAMPVSRKKVDAKVILEVFCKLEHKLNVMECVDQETDGRALIPWKMCLNVDRNLSKKELITLSCKSLYPGYKEVLDILTACVDDLMTPEEAAAWLPVLKSCAHVTTSGSETTRTSTSDNYETSLISQRSYPTT